MSLSSAYAPTVGIFAAARITLVYSTIYSVTMVNQVVSKKMLHRKLGKSFDRYNSLEMRNADRLTGNFLEWTPLFLSPLWSMAMTETFSDVSQTMAWTYLGLRMLYVGLSFKYGVNEQGHNVSLWASTLPSYICLIYLLVAATQGVFKN
jgi:uncharacterized MAPEG superfamily protein